MPLTDQTMNATKIFNSHLLKISFNSEDFVMVLHFLQTAVICVLIKENIGIYLSE